MTTKTHATEEYFIEDEPFYQPVGEEVAIFQATWNQKLPVLLKGPTGCEALESLGDRYAIYGFSGMARKRCEIYKSKEFSEPYNDEIRARISGIEAKDYTRMGFAIRHLTKILAEIDARTRILITLSDGKPDDYDNYRGDYGIEDSRRALIEARRAGSPSCECVRLKPYLQGEIKGGCVCLP